MNIPNGLKVLADAEALILNVVETKPLDPDEEVEEDAMEFGADPTKVEAIKQKGDQ